MKKMLAAALCTAAAMSARLITPYIHGMDTSGKMSFTASSPQRPDVTVAPLEKSAAVSSALSSLFVNAYICARKPAAKNDASGSAKRRTAAHRCRYARSQRESSFFIHAAPFQPSLTTTKSPILRTEP